MTKITKHATLLACLLLSSIIAAGCTKSSERTVDPAGTGSIDLALTLSSGATINSVSYEITGGGITPVTGSLDISDPSASLSLFLDGLPAGGPYTITMNAASTPPGTTCMGAASGWSVMAGATTALSLTLDCSSAGNTGAVMVNGMLNNCPLIRSVSVQPTTTGVGGTITLSASASDAEGSPLTYAWTAVGGGTFSAPAAASGSYVCSAAGPKNLTLSVSDGSCTKTKDVVVTCVPVGGAAPSVVINEVESNGGTPGDWIELFNAGGAPVDISGFRFKDNDDTHANYLVPAGTVLAPGGYYLLEEAAFGFGLGGADSARLWDASGVPVDSYAWTAHAAITYGRCPNGTGSFGSNAVATKGGANSCGGGSDAGGTGGAGGTAGMDAGGTGGTGGAGMDAGGGPVAVVINEVESNGGVPGDWVELFNAGSTPADISGFQFKDNDDTHAAVLVPAGTVLPAGGYYVLEEAAIGFGLGGADSARLWNASGAPVDSYAWTVHADVTYGRCPNGTGVFANTASSTKGAANSCGSGDAGVPDTGGGTGGTGGMDAGMGGADGGAATPIVINEVESNGGVPGDWVELYNPSSSAVDISGFQFKDNDVTHAFYVVPAGTSVPAGGYYLLEEAAFSFGLGAADSTLLLNAGGAQVDTYSWTAHAATTYGRCPNGSGAFVTTAASTKGAANSCGAPPVDAGAPDTGPAGLPWPGLDTVVTVDETNAFTSNLSGLHYQPAAGGSPAVLWAVQNSPSKLYRLLWNGTTYTPDPSNDWAAGKLVHYPTGLGQPDCEGVTKAEWTDSAIYIATERDNGVSGVSRLAILRVDSSAAGAELTATNEWNLTATLPVAGPNLGLEAITYIPDTALVAKGFFDEAANAPYNPASYPNHGTGLFFVGVEADGMIYGFALNHVTNTFVRVASFPSGQISIMDLAYDRDVGQLWGQCDDTCGNKATVFRIGAAAPAAGRFQVGRVFERPGTMPNTNNEGITFGPESECSAGQKPFFWSDDSNINSHAIRRGSLQCGTIF